MNLPGLGHRISPDEAARVRALVSDQLADDVAVMVTELACTEPGCPPRETVIALMYPGAPAQFKIHLPLAEVTAAHVATVIGTDTDTDTPEAEHDHP